MTAGMIFGNRVNYLFPDGYEKVFFSIHPIERWIIRDKEICLFRDERQLGYELLDKSTGKLTRGPIKTNPLYNDDDNLNYILNCQPEVSKTGEVRFVSRSLPYAQRWIIGDKELSLCEKNNQLTYKILDYNTHETIEGSVPIPSGASIQDAIRYLSNCQPLIADDQTIKFSPRFPSCKEWTFRNKVVRLLKKDEDLIWELFDKSTKTFSQAPFQKGSIYWEKLLEDGLNSRISMADIPHASQSPASYQYFFSDCDIEKLEVTPTPSLSHRLTAVYAKQIVKKSELNPSVRIDDQSWAVTLINSGKSGLSNPLTWAGHAAIIIESRKKGAFITYKAHLRSINNASKVLLTKIEENKEIFYNQKRETWKVDSLDARKMLKAIKWEIKKQDENDPQIDFDIRGCKSELVKPILIQKYASYNELIAKTLGAECLDLSSESSDPVPLKSIRLKDRNGNKWIKTNKQLNTKGIHYFSPQQIFIQNKNDNGWTEYRIPDNCMTWARRKLKDCGIYLERNALNEIYAAPKGYMKRGKGLQDFKIESSQKWNLPNNKEGYTPLMEAIEEGDLKKVKNLIADGVDLSKKNKMGFNALHVACKKNNIKMVKLLLGKDMKANEPPEGENNKYTPLVLAVESRNQSLIKLLLKNGANVNYQDSENNTVLHFVASDFCPDKTKTTAEILLKHGAKIDMQNLNKETPLHLAVQNEKFELASLFLQSQANPYRLDIFGHGPLWSACYLNNESMVRLLITHGIDLILFQSYPEDSFFNPFLLVEEKKFTNLKTLLNEELAKQIEQKQRSVLTTFDKIAVNVYNFANSLTGGRI